MNRRNQERVRVLERRRDFLASRVANYRKDGDPSRDKAELHALNFALRVLASADAQGVLDELDCMPAVKA